MSRIPDGDNIRYTRRHEWVMLDDDIATVGITDHAQGEIPGASLAELPADGSEVDAGDETATIESDNDALSVLAPLGGTVVEVNRLLEDNPWLINADPYGDGWLYRLEPSDLAAWRDLLTAEEYADYLGE